MQSLFSPHYRCYNIALCNLYSLRITNATLLLSAISILSTQQMLHYCSLQYLFSPHYRCYNILSAISILSTLQMLCYCSLFHQGNIDNKFIFLIASSLSCREFHLLCSVKSARPMTA